MRGFFYRLQKWLSELVFLREFPYWVAALTVGLAAVGFAKVFTWAEAFSLRMLELHPYVFLVLCPTFFVISWALVHFFSPEASGSGIPQVMVSIKRLEDNPAQARVDRLLSFRTILIKILSSIFCVLGGGAIGREGPTVQISATLFYQLSSQFERFGLRKPNREFMLVTGGAAGIAAAFNTPLGGIVYAIEELATSHFNRFKTSLIAAVIISGMASQWVSGPYLYFGFPSLKPTDLGIIPWTLAVSLVCGLAGSIFGKSLFGVHVKTKRLRTTQLRLMNAAFCGLAIALIALFINPHAIGSGKEQVVQLLFTKDVPSATLPLVRFFTPILSYMAGTAGGIFAPSLAAGGTIGYWLGSFVHPDHLSLFILLGMIAFLTGVTRAPFTAFVLVLEMTDRHSAIFPMMLAALVAQQVARMLHSHSVYELLAKIYSTNGTYYSTNRSQLLSRSGAGTGLLGILRMFQEIFSNAIENLTQASLKRREKKNYNKTKASLHSHESSDAKAFSLSEEQEIEKTDPSKKSESDPNDSER